MIQETALGLEILRDVARISNSTLNLDEILAQTLDIVKNKLHIDACSIYLIETENEQPRLKLKASSGMPEGAASNIYLKPGKGVTGWVAQNKKTLALSDALQDPRFVYFPEIEEERFQSMLSVPMLYQDECIGVINVHTLAIHFFSPPEIAVLETLSGQITGCIRNALEFQRSQLLLKEQTLLYDISLAVQGTMKMDHQLWILLTGITLGGAGGFNRALLFLTDDQSKVLQGYMGLGPDSPEAAGYIWSELRHKKGDVLHWILTESDRNEYQQSAFNSLAQGLTIPLKPGTHVLAEAALLKRPFLIDHPQEHSLVPREFAKLLGSSSFAVVPLVPHQETLGVLLVDNRYNNAPITDNDMALLTRLTTHIGWVIENSRLFNKLLKSNQELLSTKEQLIQSEKLAAMGELAAEVAHEIKNPMVSIGGFTRRLRDQLTHLCQDPNLANLLDSPIQYSGIIINEVERMERLLNNILQLSQAEQLELEDVNINELILEVIKSFQVGIQKRNIELKLHLPREKEVLPIDRSKIKQVMINILSNAMESMPRGGLLQISSLPYVYINDREMLALCFEDSGGGISQKTFENIFHPFFTTKATGTGLGLSISRKIVESHGGTLQLKNNPNQGVTVYLYLPLQNPANYNKN